MHRPSAASHPHLAYFSDSYSASRARFISAATDVGATLDAWPHPLGTAQAPLEITTAYWGPKPARRVIIIVSGTHGVEGYVGAACQTALLARGETPKDCAFLFVHALNPWGFAHNQRGNEHNVDLNRNFLDFSAPPPDNPDYARYRPYLLPNAWQGFARIRADAMLYKELMLGRRKQLQAAITRGQYAFADELFYGGQDAAWSHQAWREIIAPFDALPHSVIDLHTGLGAWGQAQLLSSLGQDTPAFRHMQAKLPCQLISTTHHDTSIPQASGALIDTLADDSQSLVLELGTYTPTKVLNALRKNRIAARTGDAVSTLKPVFCPDAPPWRIAVIRQFLSIVDSYVSLWLAPK